MTWKIGTGTLVAGILHAFLLQGVRFESLVIIILGVAVLSLHHAKKLVLWRLNRLRNYRWFYRLTILKLWMLLSLAGVFVIVQVMIMTAAMTAQDGNADYAIVLGAGIIRREPSYTLARRLDYAVEYLNNNPKGKVVVAGGRSEGQLASEAQVMKWYLEGQGIEASRVLMEEQSTNTLENLRNGITLLRSQEAGKIEEIVIITSDYHLLRAQLIGRRIGIDPYGITASSPTNLYWYYATREFAALFKSMATDW